jgi:hypothetical protein
VHSNFEGLIEIGVIKNQNMTQATWVLGPIQTRNFRPIVADPGSGAFFCRWIRYPDPGSGMGKKSGSGINIPDHFPESIETVFWVKIFKFFDADPIFLILDPE